MILFSLPLVAPEASRVGKNTFQARNLGAHGGLPREGGEQGSEDRIMAHIQEARVLEGGDSPVTCHHACGQLFFPEEVSKELGYLGNGAGIGSVSHPPSFCQRWT